MSVYIHKNNQQLGPFEEKAVLAWLKNGQLSGEDFGCPIGAKEWQKLKILFASNPPPLAHSVSIPPASNGGGQGFINQPVVNWARLYLQQPVAVQARYNSDAAKVVIIILVAFLGIFILGIPLINVLGGIYTLITQGLMAALNKGLLLSLILFIFCAGLFFGIGLLLRGTRKNLAAVLNLEGVETRGGKKHLWENLYYLDYKEVNTNVHGNLTATVARELIHAGSQKVSIDMVFANGKTHIPPLISNQAEILGLLNTMPAQRRDHGRIRQ